LCLGVALADAGRDALLDESQERGQVVGQLIGGQVRPGRDHPATDVDTDCSRDDRTFHESNGADGGSNSDVRVGHEGERLTHERQAGSSLGLLHRRVFNLARSPDKHSVTPFHDSPFFARYPALQIQGSRRPLRDLKTVSLSGPRCDPAGPPARPGRPCSR
jgi:hypothetical protein